MLAKPVPRVPGFPGIGYSRSKGHKKGSMLGVSRRNTAHRGRRSHQGSRPDIVDLVSHMVDARFVPVVHQE